MDYLQEIDARVRWIKEILVKAKAKGVVLGLSGGKDSAVVAALCARAGYPVYGVQLPIFSSNKDNEYINSLLENVPEIQLIDWNIRASCPPGTWNKLEEAFMLLSDSFTPPIDRSLSFQEALAEANIKPRLRMIALYALAQRRNCLVAGTGNADEAYVGYFTKWGDGANDFNPIADLHVSEVIALGKALGLGDIVDRVPSAGLWEGQTDETELGVTYSEIEAVIEGKTENISEEAISIIQTRHEKALHKLNPIPVYSDVKKHSVCF